MATRPEWISEVTFYSTEKSGNGPEARGSVSIADSIFVRFALFRGDDGGYRLSLPSTVNGNFNPNQPVDKKNRKYFEEVGFLNMERRTEAVEYISSCLLAERTKGGGGGGSGKPSSGGKKSSSIDSDIPF